MGSFTENTSTKTPKVQRNFSFKAALKELDARLNQQNVVTTLMGSVEKATKVTKRIQFLGVVSFILFYLTLGYAAAILCNTIALAFPFYATVRAIESAVKSGDEVKWLMYWVVFGSVNFVEMFIAWIPSYYLLKVLLLLWCMAPGTFNGAHVIYHRLIRPFVMIHKDTLDTAISQVAKTVRQEAERAAEDYRPDQRVDLQAKILIAIKQVGRLRGFSDNDAAYGDASDDTADKVD